MELSSLIEKLTEVLQKEKLELEKLVKLSTEKTSVIIKGDIGALQKITEDEQSVAGSINQLNNGRDTLMEQIANAMNKDVQTLTLRDIVGEAEGRSTKLEDLALLHDELKVIAESMNRSNSQNKELLENALEMVDFDMNLVKSMNSAASTSGYGKDANMTGHGAVNAQRTFDATQ